MGMSERENAAKKLAAAHDRLDAHAKVIEQYNIDLTAHKKQINVLTAQNSDLKTRVGDLREELDIVKQRLATPWYRRTFGRRETDRVERDDFGKVDTRDMVRVTHPVNK